MLPLSHPLDPLVCPLCIAELRPQRTRFDFQALRYECLLHGPVVAKEFLDLKVLAPHAVVEEWWT